MMKPLTWARPREVAGEAFEGDEAHCVEDWQLGTAQAALCEGFTPSAPFRWRRGQGSARRCRRCASIAGAIHQGMRRGVQ